MFPFKNSNKIGTTNESNRVHWLENALKKIPDNSTILDAGAGEQQFKRFCNHLKYTSQDIAEYDGSGGTGLQTGTWDYGKLDIVSDICNIPRPDESFDAIMCTEVLEHVPDAVSALKELNRLLKPGGYIVLTAPFCSLTHFAPYHYSTGFNKYFYQKHLEEEFGYKILDIQSNGNYFEYLGQELRRLSRVAEDYTNTGLSVSDKIGIRLLLNGLEKFNNNSNKSSSELLCFGYQVLAQKK